MSASQIPNLNTLRSGRGFAGRGGLRGLARSGIDPEAADKIVQQTDQDAFQSRMSAISLGYLDDPYSKDFVQDAAAAAPRRYPIINRGTYVRTTAIDRLVAAFVAQSSTEPKQILSLGAGSDTRFFRLRSKFPSASFVYHEVDFPANTAQKISSIQSSTACKLLIGEFSLSQQGSCLNSPSYNVHALDLRTLTAGAIDKTSAEGHDEAAGFKQLLDLPHISTSTPTLILSECCLVYLPPVSADSLLTQITSAFSESNTALSLILYEPIRPFDSFGQVMISNLATRGIVLQTLKKYGSLIRQRQRLRTTAGLADGQAAADVNFIWERWVTEAEKGRVSRLEMVDEVEEWQLLAQHYCIAWGWRNGMGNQATVFQQAWGEFESQEEDDEAG